MKARGSLFFSLLTGVLIFGAFYYPNIDNAQKEAIIMQTLINGLNQLHYQPVELNDEFSKKAFNLYVERLDGLHRFFTQSEIDQLKNFENKIDDQVNGSNYEFFDLSYQLYSSAIKRTSGFYKDLLKEPFDFSKEDVIETDGEKRHYAKNEKELKRIWRNWFKYETLIRLSDKIEEQKNDKEEDLEEKSFETLEKEARQAVEKRYNRLFERMAKDRRSDRLSDYLNAITNVYDPHTGYFEPKDKANFDISMSGTLEGIGARLQEHEDYTKVSSIVPGGPAWKQKGLEVDDKIVKVAQGDEEPIDVTGMRVDDVVKYIRGKKGTVVKLTVKKVDGTTQVIPITRDIVIMGESFAKSLIIESKEEIGKVVGYIRLPRFYADFNRRGGRSCAVDVAKEVAKLKEENVNGIILDLRNNGGGSLRDVVRMSGLFIEEGPIVQVKGRESKAEVLKDKDPRVQYDGPLIVMVNSYSASASEILAAALQDYGRAVIVGSNSTFGKGTVQRFFDLDRAIRGFSEIKPLGEVKLTIQKFYRVNGGSTQLKGVVPDVILPDRYHYLDLGEKEHDFPLVWTEINPVDYSQAVSSLDNLEEVKTASAQRVGNNENFRMILKSAKRLKDQREDTDQTLNLEEYQKWADELEVESKKYKEIAEKEVIAHVRNIKVDLMEIEKEESKQASNEDWIKTIKKDIYIDEVLNIMHDMVKKQ